jgi:ankyrin repeat protein
MLLQDDRFDINARNCRSATPLHIASQNGAVEAVKMLCKANCDLNATNEWGESALHVAVQSAQSNCITVLLEAGCKTDLVDKWGQTPCEVIGICICALESWVYHLPNFLSSSSCTSLLSHTLSSLRFALGRVCVRIIRF